MLLKSGTVPEYLAVKGILMTPYRTSIVFSTRMSRDGETIAAWLRKHGGKDNLGNIITHAVEWWHEHRHDTPLFDLFEQHYKNYRTDVAIEGHHEPHRNVYLQNETMEMVAQLGEYLHGLTWEGMALRGLKSTRATKYRPDWFWNIRMVIAFALALRANAISGNPAD